MENRRLSDTDVFEMLDRIDNADLNDEKLSKDAIKMLIGLIFDTRVLVRKVYKNMYKKPTTKVYTQPTDNAKDIIVGTKGGQ